MRTRALVRHRSFTHTILRDLQPLSMTDREETKCKRGAVGTANAVSRVNTEQP